MLLNRTNTKGMSVMTVVPLPLFKNDVKNKKSYYNSYHNKTAKRWTSKKGPIPTIFSIFTMIFDFFTHISYPTIIKKRNSHAKLTLFNLIYNFIPIFHLYVRDQNMRLARRCKIFYACLINIRSEIFTAPFFDDISSYTFFDDSFFWPAQRSFIPHGKNGKFRIVLCIL